MLVVGITGAQGSGKSTLAAGLAAHFTAAGCQTAVLSLDDLYLPRADRDVLAAAVHPLLATRGVPGTHEPALGMAIIAALRAGHSAALPRFDKAVDDRSDVVVTAPADTQLLIVEGWCLGAQPEPDAALVVPVNALEANEDADGGWRQHVNAQLSGAYRAFFAQFDCQILLLAPDWPIVAQWRAEQEAALKHAAGDQAAGMNATELERFMQHFERLSRWIMADLPPRADLVLRLDRQRRVIA